MDRYELVEGTSSKFWEVEVSGADLTVRFGRIGTAGQSKTKDMGSAAAAEKERDKLVKEKTGKGYRHTGAVAGAAAAPAGVAPPAPTAPPTQVAVAPPPAALPPEPPPPPGPTPTSPSTLPAPVGGFQWTDELRAQLAPVRGVEQPLAFDAASDPPTIRLTEPRHGWQNARLGALAAAAGQTWRYWGGAGSTAHITADALARPDTAWWLELVMQVRCNDAVGFQRDTTRLHGWVVRRATALHGLPFTVALIVRAWEVEQAAQPRWGTDTALLLPLRVVMANAGADALAEAEHAAEALAAATGGDASPRWPVLSYLFPHRADWAAKAVDLPGLDETGCILVKDSVLPAARFTQAMRRIRLAVGWWKPSVLLQVRLHGDAALEALALLLQQSIGDRHSTAEALKILTAMRVPGLVDALVDSMDDRDVRAALEALQAEFPAAVLRRVIERAMARQDRMAEGWAVRLALKAPAARDAALDHLEPAVAARFRAVLAALDCAEASPEQLPDLLREPPWLRKARPSALPVLAIDALPLPDILNWTDAERAQAQKVDVPPWLRNRKGGVDGFPADLGLTPEGARRLRAGEPLQAGDLDSGESRYPLPASILMCPPAARLALWNSYPARRWNTWDDNWRVIRALLAEYGTAALPGAVAYARAFPLESLSQVGWIDSPQLVPIALHGLRNLKKARDPAGSWLRRHARTAITVALPIAFQSEAGAERDDARHGLRWLCAQGFEAQAQAIAQAHGPDMAAALDALRAQDPLLVLPARMPRLPGFFSPGAFRRPMLSTGEALPAAALEHIGTMLAISRLDAPYAGVEVVRGLCTPASLAEFAWDVFEAWIAGGAPSKEAWAFTALGLLGDDETARRLAPRIREWPGEAQHARAVTGLDILASIGTDVALMHLNGIAGKAKFKGLQERAREKIAAVAEARGFTPEELADRLVPDLGLEDNGTVTLDFGPRRFTIGFDEALKPFVRDAQGARLKDLPKPVKSDDAALAEAATERYKLMKKDAKAIAALQLMRLEQAMVSRRRWRAGDFRLFFLEHPLMRHLATRLVWGVYGPQGLQTCFRVAEDWTLADAEDTACTLAADAQVGIAHVLEMRAEQLTSFGQLFADYEIQQPFRQLARETHALTPDEQKQTSITRFKDKTVATGSVLGLANRGWERGQAEDGGWIGWFSKRLPGGLQVDAQLDPGTVVGDTSYEPKQRITTLELRRTGTWAPDGLVPFSQLDPILASEVLRDIDQLAPLKE